MQSTQRSSKQNINNKNIQEHQYNLIQFFYIIGIDNKDKAAPRSSILSKYPNSTLSYLSIPDDIIINHTFPNGIIIQTSSTKSEFFFYELENTNSVTRKKYPKLYLANYIFKDKLDDTSHLFTEKSWTLSSFFPFFKEFQIILSLWYSWITSNKMPVTFEAAVYSLVFEIPSPTRGIYNIEYNFMNWVNWSFSQEPINKWNNTGLDLKMWFNIFTISSLLKLIKFVLLERPIILFYEDKFKLSCLIQGLISLIYPIKYIHPVISVLPVAYITILENWDVYIVGINSKYSSDFLKKRNINLMKKEYVIVEINDSLQEKSNIHFIPKNDNCRVVDFEDLSRLTKENNDDKYSNIIYSNSWNFKKNNIHYRNTITDTTNLNWYQRWILPRKYSQDNSINNAPESVSQVKLPYYYTEKLANKLKTTWYSKTIKNKVKDEVKNEEIIYDFYYYFVSILWNYKSYIITDKASLSKIYDKIRNNSIDIREWFKVDEYLLTVPNDSLFYMELFKTKTWKMFIINNLFPQTILEKMEILLFDEMVTMKENKKLKKFIKTATPFWNNIQFEKRKTIKVGFNGSYSSVLNQTNKGIDNDKIIYYYSNCDSFPNLDSNIFNRIINDSLNKPDNLQDAFELECLQVIKNSIFGEIYKSTNYDLNWYDKINPNMQIYVYKLYFRWFSLTFMFIDLNEKWTRFHQLVSIISKLPKDLSSSILNNEMIMQWFNVVTLYGDKHMSSMWYYWIPIKSYILFLWLHSKNSQSYILPNYSFLKKRNYNIYNLKTSEDKIVDIFLKSTCPKCNSDNDWQTTINNFDSMESKDILFYTCVNCQKEHQAKMNVKVGKWINKQFNLFSPYYLYTFFNTYSHLDFNTFPHSFQDVFYNCVVYFQFNNLPFDFWFPYKSYNTQKYSSNKLQIVKTRDTEFIPLSEKKRKWFNELDHSTHLNVSFQTLEHENVGVQYYSCKNLSGWGRKSPVKKKKNSINLRKNSQKRVNTKTMWIKDWNWRNMSLMNINQTEGDLINNTNTYNTSYRNIDPKVNLVKHKRVMSNTINEMRKRGLTSQ